jgi:U3 small nucleolar RNA-associated protein 19
MAPRSLPPANKRKNTVVENISAGLIEEVVLLEKQITDALQNGGSLNALADLVLLAQTSSANVTSTSKSIYALYRIYVTLLSSGKLMPGGDDAAKVVRTWIWERLNIYTDILCGLLQDTDKSLRVSDYSPLK